MRNDTVPRCFCLCKREDLQLAKARADCWQKSKRTAGTGGGREEAQEEEAGEQEERNGGQEQEDERGAWGQEMLKERAYCWQEKDRRMFTAFQGCLQLCKVG